MGSITDYAEAELLDHAHGTAYSPVGTVYLALATADPTDAATGGSFNEVADANAYARTAITFGAYASNRVTQSGDVQFPQAGGSWGNMTHWAVVDSGTHGAGNVLAHGALNETETVQNGDTLTIPTTTVYVEMSAGEGISDYLRQKLLELMFRNVAYTAPATYIGATTATVSDSDTGSTITEPAVGGYARELVNENGGGSPAWDLATGTTPTEVDNGNAVTLGPASGADWGTLVSIVTCDAPTSGNLLFYDNTNFTDTAINDGDSLSLPAGDINHQIQ